MRNWIITACIAGQLAVLAYMVIGRETIIHQGTTVRIATAPIDPRDPFRGDFVRLRYPLNTLSHAPVRWQPADYQPRKGDKMYAILEPRAGGLHDVAYFSNLPPASDSQSLFLRGRIQRPVSWSGRNQVEVRYGIEQLFVEQGSGIDIEQRRGIRGGMQNAMHASIAIGDNGSAVLTGFTWSSIAIGLEITETFALPATTATTDALADSGTQSSGTEPRTPESDPESVTQERAPVKLTITNVSNASVTLDNPGDNCGFRLEPLTRSHSPFFQPEGICEDLPMSPVTLAAGESLNLDIDLANPRWHMSQKIDDVIQTGDIRTFRDSREWFRLVYRSQEQENRVPDQHDVDVESAENTPYTYSSDVTFWQGDIVSQAFSAWGQTD